MKLAFQKFDSKFIGEFQLPWQLHFQYQIENCTSKSKFSIPISFKIFNLEFQVKRSWDLRLDIFCILANITANNK